MKLLTSASTSARISVLNPALFNKSYGQALSLFQLLALYYVFTFLFSQEWVIHAANWCGHREWWPDPEQELLHRPWPRALWPLPGSRAEIPWWRLHFRYLALETTLVAYTTKLKVHTRQKFSKCSMPSTGNSSCIDSSFANYDIILVKVGVLSRQQYCLLARLQCIHHLLSSLRTYKQLQYHFNSEGIDPRQGLRTSVGLVAQEPIGYVMTKVTRWALYSHASSWNPVLI